jgi:hypothetical protein
MQGRLLIIRYNKGVLEISNHIQFFQNTEIHYCNSSCNSFSAYSARYNTVHFYNVTSYFHIVYIFAIKVSNWKVLSCGLWNHLMSHNFIKFIRNVLLEFLVSKLKQPSNKKLKQQPASCEVYYIFCINIHLLSPDEISHVIHWFIS